MIPPVEIDFVARGVSELGRTFDLLDKRLQGFELRNTRTAREGAKDRVRISEREERDRELAYRKLERETERLESESKRHAERSEREKTRATERAEAERMRIRIRSSEMAGRIAEREAERELSTRKRISARMGGFGASTLGRAGGAVTMLAGAAGIGGGFLIADVMRERADAAKKAGQLVNIVTVGNGNVTPAGANVSNILGKAGQVAVSTGAGKQEIVDAALSYAQHAKGGDFGGVMKNMEFFAKVSQVTGASMSELAGAAGTLQSQNAALTPEDMQRMLLNVYAQSGKGSMSMVDIAKQMGTMASQRSAFTGNMGKTQQSLLGLGQIVAPQGSIEEAGTFTKDLVEEALKKQDKLKALGVKFKGGQIDMTPEELVAQSLAGAHGDLGVLQKIFEGRGAKIFGAVKDTFDAAGGGQKGREAVMRTLTEVTGATMSPQQLEQQSRQMLEDPSKKFEMAMTRIKETLETSLEPALRRFADRLPEIVPVVERIIDKGGELATWFAENPIKGVGAVILASVTKDIAAAGIGAAVKAIISSMLLESGGASTAAKVAGGAGGNLGKLGLAAAAGVGAAAFTQDLIDTDVAGKSGEQSDTIAGSTQYVAYAGAMARKAREGRITAADLATIQRRAGVAREAVEEAKGNIGKTADPLLSLVSSGYREDVRKDEEQRYKQAQQALEALTKAAQMAEGALRTAAGSATSPGAAARHVPIPQRSVN